ncbi:MAG: rhomboid family intramembrane serine protease [Candidatus Aenigmarchaeota archaeon]|nr:rhomboid family intramembrane serine protease [Candidatus Aenigmarchaeota archaeon]
MKYNWYAIKIVIICVIVFILQFIFPITENFALVSSEFLFKPWTIVTYLFLHGDASHIFGNMFALALFGSILEKIIGGKKFLIMFFVSGIIAGMGSITFYEASIGASGAIYGIFGTLAILRPKMTVYMGLGVPMPMIAAVFFWALLDFLGFFSAAGGIAYAAHLFGLAFGLAYGFYLKKDYGENIRLKRKSKTSVSEERIREWEDRWM